jgi:hypothetical protein
MEKKKWTFLIKVFALDGNMKETIEAGKFEAVGISPYQVISGAQPPPMESENYDRFANAVAMGDFVSSIGDKNTLSIKKVRCSLTDLFSRVKNEHKTFQAISLYVTPLSAISARLRGEPRLEAIFRNSLEWVRLDNASVSNVWDLMYINNKNSMTLYDYITFETKEKPKFRFKGKDW